MIKDVLSKLLVVLYPHALYLWFKQKRQIVRSLWLNRLFKDCDATVLFGRIGLLKGLPYILIGKNTVFGDWIYLTAWDTYYPISNKVTYDGIIEKPQKNGKYIQHLTPELTIGEKCSFGAFNHITCTNRVQIDNGLLTGKWVTITDNSHGATDYDSFLERYLDLEKTNGFKSTMQLVRTLKSDVLTIATKRTNMIQALWILTIKKIANSLMGVDNI